jgi:hypothetical protein
MSQSGKETEASLQDPDHSEDKEYEVIPLGFYKWDECKRKRDFCSFCKTTGTIIVE